MNRNLIINSAVAAVIVALVVSVFILEGRSNETAATTTTTSTTIATTTTTTTTTVPLTTTTTTVPETTTTSTTSTVPPTTEPALPRELWKVIVVNGSTSGERLQPTIDRLEDIGYVDVRGLVGAVQTTQSVIYYLLPGQENAADRLRADLELFDVPIAGFDQAPPVAGRNDAQLMIYLGGS